MNRRDAQAPPPTELEEIEAALQALTLRVALLRGNLEANTAPAWTPTIGDRVRLSIPRVGVVEGTVVDVTAKRVKVQVPGRGLLIRAKHNVSRI